MTFIVLLVLTVIGLISGMILRFLGRKENFQYSEECKLAGGWTFGVTAIFFIGVITTFFTTIPTGAVGVQTVFGKIQSNVLTEGLTTKNPLAKVTKMTARTQSYTMSIRQNEGDHNDPDAVRVLSKDNLEMDMDLSVLYALVPGDAQKVFRELGDTEAYTEKLVRPSIRRAIRDTASQFNAAELMSTTRSSAEKGIFAELTVSFSDYFKQKNIEKGIIVEAVMLRNVQPPPSLKAAIEDKLTKQQQKEGMEFVLETEKKRAEQRVIEARGLADSQAIIDRTLTKEYLQFKYIEALAALVNSPNHSTIILPFDQKLTPMLNVGADK